MTVWKEFNKNELTHSAAHYLMAIDELHQSQGYARLIDLANHLEISKGSLSTSLKPLIKKNFIREDEHKHLFLSKKGQAFAAHIKNTYSVTYRFFTEILKLPAQAAEIEACKIEHLLSGQTVNELEKFLKKPKHHCPTHKILAS